MRRSTPLAGCRSRRRRGAAPSFALALALALAGATLGAAGTAGAAPATSPSPWNTQATLGTTFVLASAVACASPTDCYALGRTDGTEGAGFLSSVDSGQAWTPATLPGVPVDFDLISCPAVGVCFIAGPGHTGTVMYETKNGAVSWTAVRLPASIDLYALTCRSTTWCVAGGFSVKGSISIVTGNGGASWTTVSAPGQAIGTISCASESVCYSASDGGYSVDVTTDGAKAWKALSLPRLTGLLTGVSCTSTVDCVVVGAKEVGQTADPLALVTTDGGSVWKAEPMPAGLSILLDVSCPSAKVCVSINASASTGASSAVVTTNGGASWRAIPLTVQSSFLSFLTPTGGVVACPSTSVCVTSGEVGGAGNDRMLYSSTGGATWRTSALPAGGFVGALACWSSSGCLGSALTNTGPTTEVTTNGSTWAARALSGFAAIADVTCTGASTCVGLGETPALKFAFVRTIDGGTSWTSAFTYSLAAGTLPLSLDCPSTTVCYATFSVPNGSTGSSTVLEHTVDGGTAWSPVVIPNGVAQSGFGAVTCATTSACTLSNANGSIEYTGNSGTRWVTAALPAGYGQAGPLACGSSTSCVTIADGSASSVSTLFSTDAGAHWKTAGALPADFNGDALVCRPAADCELLGRSGTGAPLSYASTSGGTAWTLQAAPARLGSDGQWRSLACPAAGRCEASAVGPAGAGYLFGLG